MIGPPALKFRMKKFELFVGSSGGAGLASGVTLAVTVGEVPAAGAIVASIDAPAAGAVPGAAGTLGATVVPGAAASGAPGAVVVPGAGGTAGDAARSAGDAAGLVAGGADGTWAKAATAMVRELRLTNSVFFI